MKLKDYVTMGNLLCGFGSVVMVMRGEFNWAVALIYIGYGFDVGDGLVARLTKQYDKFGGEFDNMCDYVTNSIAPSFILYYFFYTFGGFPWWLAAAIGAFPITFGTIRHARSVVENTSYPCYWLGLPRPVYTLAILAVIHSSLFHELARLWPGPIYGGMAGIVAVLSFAHLSYFPFVSHHKRRWMAMLKYGALIFAASPVMWLIGLALFGHHLMFYDYMLFCMLAYLCIAWTNIPNEDWARIRHFRATGELLLPLVHKESDWVPQTFIANKWEH